jgi:hypothetical protein
VELIVLTFANLLATVLRFVLFRVWVFRSQRESATPADLAHRETFSRDAMTTQEPTPKKTVSFKEKVTAS